MSSLAAPHSSIFSQHAPSFDASRTLHPPSSPSNYGNNTAPTASDNTRNHAPLRRLSPLRPTNALPEYTESDTTQSDLFYNKSTTIPAYNTDVMYFASSSAPALTPLGVRLLALSRNKLTGMDCDNAGMLHRSVIVREAVRSAWASIEDGSSSSDLTNWRAPTALGLATLSEEDEDEDEYNQADAEARYLDDVLSTLGNDDDEADLAWAETTVSRPAADDFESDETFQAFTLPSVQVLSAADAIDTEDYYDSSYSTHSTYRTGVTVIEAAYDSDSDYDEDEYAEMSASWVELDSDNHAIDPLAVSQELEEVVTPPMYYASLPPEQAMAAELALAEIEHAEFANAIASTASSGSPPRLEVHTPKCETPPLVAVLHHQDQEPEQEPEPERQEPPETQNTKSSGLRPVPFKFASTAPSSWNRPWTSTTMTLTPPRRRYSRVLAVTTTRKRTTRNVSARPRRPKQSRSTSCRL